MAVNQSKASTSWAISAGLSVSGGAKKIPAGGGGLILTLFDVESQIFFPLYFGGPTLGVSTLIGFSVSTFSPSFFTTSKPLWAQDFSGKLASTGTVEFAPGIGASFSYITFLGIDHNPCFLDIGGLEVGLAGGGGITLGGTKVSLSEAQPNKGCVISPNGDPLCGGTSNAPTQTVSPNQSYSSGR